MKLRTFEETSQPKVTRQEDKTEVHELGSMLTCQYCAAKKFEFESPTFCFDSGKIILAETDIPDELYMLFSDNVSREAISFRKKIRAYNSIFAFTSFGVNMDKALASSIRGIYTFRVLGQVFHTLPPLIPHDDIPSYFQLYFWDNTNELNNRLNVLKNADLSGDTMELLMGVMEKNLYAQLLRRINDFPSVKDLTLQICKDEGLDQRCYNTPTADQVAAIWVEGNNPNTPHDRDIIIHDTNGQQHRIKHYYGCYDALQYPLLFPEGENGWHQNIPKFKDGNANMPHQQEILHGKDFSSLESILGREQTGII